MVLVSFTFLILKHGLLCLLFWLNVTLVFLCFCWKFISCSIVKLKLFDQQTWPRKRVTAPPNAVAAKIGGKVFLDQRNLKNLISLVFAISVFFEKLWKITNKTFKLKWWCVVIRLEAFIVQIKKLFQILCHYEEEIKRTRLKIPSVKASDQPIPSHLFKFVFRRFF